MATPRDVLLKVKDTNGQCAFKVSENWLTEKEFEVVVGWILEYDRLGYFQTCTHHRSSRTGKIDAVIVTGLTGAGEAHLASLP